MAHLNKNSSNNSDGKLVPGRRFLVEFEGRKEVEAVVIDPNGWGTGRPSLGFSFRGLERQAGINQSALSRWTEGAANLGVKTLQLPSGKSFTLMQIPDRDGNIQYIIRIEDTMEMVADLIENPGKLRRETIKTLIRFLVWFAIKGFYASTYAQYLGGYSAEDDRAISEKLQQLQEERDDLMILNTALSKECDRLEQEAEESSEYYWQAYLQGQADRQYCRYLEARLEEAVN